MTLPLLGFTIGAATLLFWTGSSEIYGLPKLIGAAAGIAASGLILGFGARGAVRRTPLDYPLAALGAAFSLSLAFSPDRWIGIVGVYSLYNFGGLAFFLSVALYYFAAWSPAPKTIDLLRVFSGIGMVSASYACLQGLGVELIPSVSRVLPEGRAIGSLGDPVFLGASLIAIVPVSAHLARTGKRNTSMIGWVGIFLTMGALWMSGSRGSWLGAAAAFGVWWYCVRMSESSWVPDWRASLVGLVIILIASAGLLTLRGFSKRSDAGRIGVWKNALAVFQSAPVLGVGPDRYQTAMRRHRDPALISLLGSRGTQVSAHNDWLQVLATLGIVGAAAWAWLHWGFWLLLRSAWKEKTRRPLASVCAGVLAGLIVQAKINPIPLVCFLQAAVLLGLLVSRPSVNHVWRKQSFGFLFGALAAGICFLSVRLLVADLAFAEGKFRFRAKDVRGGLAAFERAVALNPYEMFYRVGYSKALFMSAVANPLRAQEYLERAIAVGDEGVRLRPTETEGYLIGATYRLVFKSSGGEADLDIAADAVEKALAIDPFFIPALDNGARIASLRGDTVHADELRRRLKAMRTLMEGR